MHESGGRRQALAGVAVRGQLVAFIGGFATSLQPGIERRPHRKRDEPRDRDKF